MPLIRAYEDVENPRIPRELPGGHRSWRTDFIKSSETDPNTPRAFLAEATPHRLLRVHFHEVDQFQVMYKGSGEMGKHSVSFGVVHFSRAYTPYGPIKYSEQGLGFVTLRAHRDPGAQFLPEKREVLEQMKGRDPWQIAEMPDFDIQPGASGVAMKMMAGMRDDRGLAGYSVIMKPGAKCFAPDPSKSNGQYILALKGSLVFEGKLKNALTVIWVGKDEGMFQLEAGPEGLQALVLNFPIPGGGKPEQTLPAADGKGEFKTWQCILCAFVYDEAAGMPDEGIAPGTRWSDVPDSFGCPDCSATKADFEMIEF